MTSRLGRVGWLAAHGFLVVLCPVAMVSAQTASRELVVLSVAAAPEMASVVESVAQDLLATLPVALEASRVSRIDPEHIVAPLVDATPSHALAHVWIDLTDHDGVTLYVHAYRTERVLVRRFERQGRSTPVVLEAMGQALVTAIEALLTGASIGVSRDEYIATLRQPPSPPTPPSPSPLPAPRSPSPALPSSLLPPSRPARGRTWVDADAGWDLSLWSRAAPVLHGPRVAITVGRTLHPWGRLGGEVAGCFRLPQAVETPELFVTIRPVVSLRASVVFDWRAHDTLHLRATLGVGLDAMDHEGFVRGPGVSLEPSRSRLSAVMRGAVGLRWRVVGSLVLGSTVGVDIDAAPIDFVIERNGTLGYVVDTWPVHPVATVTLGSSWGMEDNP